VSILDVIGLLLNKGQDFGFTTDKRPGCYFKSVLFGSFTANDRDPVPGRKCGVSMTRPDASDKTAKNASAALLFPEVFCLLVAVSLYVASVKADESMLRWRLHRPYALLVPSHCAIGTNNCTQRRTCTKINLLHF
jgi:hypothetical protein